MPRRTLAEHLLLAVALLLVVVLTVTEYRHLRAATCTPSADGVSSC